MSIYFVGNFEEFKDLEEFCFCHNLSNTYSIFNNFSVFNFWLKFKKMAIILQIMHFSTHF